MTGYLVDTNVPSELTRQEPNPRVNAFLAAAGRKNVYISVLSIAEIRRGVAVLPKGRKRDDLAHWLEHEIRPWFGPRILPVTLAIAERWADVSAEAKREALPSLSSMV